MDAALKLFEQLGIRPVQFNKQHRPGPRETTCVKLVDRMIHRHGARHSEQVLRTVADQGILVADIIEAVSDLALSHPRWSRSADWSTTFAGIDLAGIRQTAKAANIRPRRVAIAVLIAVEIEKRLGPSRPTPVKPIKAKMPPKPPRALTRVAGVEANIQLGRELLELRMQHPCNKRYSAAVRRQFDIPAQHGIDCARAARVYGDKPDIYRRLSWDALLTLSGTPAPIRTELERRILAGERIGAPQIRRAHQVRQPGRPTAMAA